MSAFARAIKWRAAFREFSHSTMSPALSLEHIENPQQAFGSSRARAASWRDSDNKHPNILNIEERLKWLLYGYTSHFKR